MVDPSYEPSELKALALSDTGFVFDPRTGHSYSLNTTGLTLLAAMKQGLEISAIVERIEAEFEGGVAVIDDVESFIERLRELGILGDPKRRVPL
jgi:Coenzyme PQQ synthesis protein D (PqqD)